MSIPMRSDFATASVGLVGSKQRANLASLHTWLVDEIGLSSTERVLAISNYQQGRFGRLPNHVLVLTNARIAFTHDGGMRAVPLVDLNPNRIGIKAGPLSADLDLVTKTGEQMRFHKGVSLALQEIAQLVPDLAGRVSAPPSQADAPGASVANGSEVTESSDDSFAGYGDDIVTFDDPTTGYAIVEFSHDGDGHFSVWTLDRQLQHGDLLVNTRGAYHGERVFGLDEPVAGVEITASGSWKFRWINDAELRRVAPGEANFDGDTVLTLMPDTQPLPTAVVAEFIATGASNFSVWAYGAGGGLLVNKIAPYTGRVIIPAGAQLLKIDSGDAWAMAVSEDTQTESAEVSVEPEAAPHTSNLPGMAVELQKLADLLQAGILTEEEFSTAKTRLINRY